MKVSYKRSCMSAEVEVDVRDREEDEDVGEWVRDIVGAAIGADHATRSPTCRQTKMEYAKIPMPENAPFIGGRPRLHS